MWVCNVISAWGKDGEGNVPQVLIDHPLVTGESYSDVTGQAGPSIPLDPNMNVVWMRRTAANLEAIEADPLYEILWAEEEAEDAF